MTISAITYTPNPPVVTGNTVTLVAQVVSNDPADLVDSYLINNSTFGVQAFAVNQAISGTAPNFTVTITYGSVPPGTYIANVNATNSSAFGGYTNTFVVAGVTTPTLSGLFSPTLTASTVNTESSYVLTVTDGTAPISGVTFTSSNGAVLPAPVATNATGQTVLALPISAGATGITLTASKLGYVDWIVTLDAVELPWSGAGGGTIGTGPVYSGTGTLSMPVNGTGTISTTGTAPIIYSLTSGAPAGVTINSATGVISSASPVVPGTYPLYVIANNSTGSTSIPISLTVTGALVPPTYTGPTSTTISSGAGFSIPLSATGSGPFTYSLIGAPSGVSIVNGVLIGTAAVTSSANFQIVTTGQTAPNDTDTFTLTVNQVVTPPTYAGATSLTINSGAGFTIPLSATGTGPFTYSLIGAPAGVSISGAFLVGTSAVTTSSSFQIVTTGQASPADTDTFNLTINPVLALAITSAASTSGQHGIGSTFQHTATGGTGPYTWSLCDAAGNSLPASSGFSINSATGVETYNGAAI
jgi:hypothetical protein